MNIIQMKHKDRPGRSDHPRTITPHHMIPNLITLTAMAAGLTAIQHALNGQWERALVAVLIALVLDGLDGATARLLKATSSFGAQLDSLSDFLAFGIAPAIILYAWILNESGKVGWVAMIFYTSAVALRLARFNVEDKQRPKWQKGFFSGVASPAGAGFALLPLILWFQFPDFFGQYKYASPLVGLWTMIVAGLMVSRIPTFSVKAIHVPARMAVTALAAAALFLAVLVNMPWPTLTAVGLLYLGSIPFAVRAFRRLEKIHASEPENPDEA
jgi:CDP-diacylglycerol--serine O-phosphatidyltransferase